MINTVNSRKVTLRLRPEQHKQLKLFAVESGVSIQNLVEVYIDFLVSSQSRKVTIENAVFVSRARTLEQESRESQHA